MAIREVYTLEEYAQLKKKKKKDDGLENVITLEENMKSKGISLDSLSSDIAPIKTTVSNKDDDESLLNFFQKGAFNDGYQFGDVTKTILGTVGDAGVGLVKGAGSLVEGVVDAGRYGVAGISDSLGNETYADKVREKAKKNSVENIFKSTDDYLNQYSVLGKTSDAILQGVGQVGGIIGAGLVGGAIGLGTAGATALTTGLMGISSTGSGMSEAYQGGATDEEATKYGISKGIIDAGTELIFGGLGKTLNAVGLSKGISSLDDVFAQKLSSKLSNQVAKNFAEFGVKASAEGFEEVLAGLGSAVAKKLTFMEEEELNEIIKDENLLEQFVVGTVTSGMIQSGYIPKTEQGSLKEANKTGRDFITGYTQNEQAVIDKEVEKRVGDQKLSKKELGEIEEQVKKDLEKGYIDIDTIESSLGGETYNQYKSITEQEETLTKQLEELKNAPNTVGNAKLYEETENKLAELKKNSNKTQIKEQLSKEVQELTKSDLLIESYNEKARRSQVYEADLTKYDEKQQAVIKKAVESGILNNTNKTHEFVDMIARISADKGVSFDFTNNTKLKDSGFAIEGKTVNGYVKDGNIAVNIDSNKALNTVVGHEITHVLEGTELYTELQNVVKEYATTKGEYDTRYKALEELYKDVDGAVIENELTADLVGEYLFTDSDFINNLSTTKPNVFKKIYDEIKYLYKLATAGSKEARQLEKVKKAFDKAYKESANTGKATDYHVSSTFAEEIDKTLNNTMNKSSQVKARDFTPEILVNNGVKDLPMLITQRHIKSTIYTEAEAKKLGLPTGGKNHYHGLGKELLIKSIDSMDSPLEIYKQDADHYLIITEMKNSNGDNVIIPIKIDGKGTYNDVYIDENQISSVYGKNNLEQYLARNNFEQIYKKRETALNEGFQLPNISDSSKNSISQNKENATSTRYSLDNENINKVTDDGLTMTYVRVPNKNTPYYGSTFGQNIEPAGEYMNMDEAKGKYKIDGYEYGTIQFKKPLVLEHINTSDTGWKKTVSDMYNGLTGKKLTKALIKDGYDAIVTYDEYGYNEIVNLNGQKLNDSQPNTRYSLSEDGKMVDAKGNEVALETSNAGTHNSLMAIHNLSADKLNGILELGGFPVPSIAIMDESNVANLSYGDISVLLDKSSIDPANKQNEVYGSDVYSKRFPRTVQAVDEKKLAKLEEYIGSRVNLEDTTLEDAKSKYRYNQAFVDKFLQENNISVEDVYKEVGYNYISGNHEGTRNFVIENDITFDKLLNDKELRNQFYELYRETMPSFTGFTEKKIARFEQAFNEGGQFAESVKSRMDKDFYSVKNGAEKVVDTTATDKLKRDTAINEYSEQYDKFLNDLLSPVFGDKYLRNNKDLYAPSGNRRTFKQLYDPYTLDNIMKNMLGKVQDNEGFFYGAGNIRSNVSQKFKSIADIKKNADKLISSEEFKHVKERINEKLETLTKESNEYGGYSFDSYAEALNDISKLKTINVGNVKRVFKEYNFDMPDSMIKKSIDFLNELKDAPTEYFEAKPQRAIGFDEVQAVVIPNNTNAELKKRLNDEGFYVVEYDPNIEGDRANKINQFDNLKFSLSNQNQNATQTGNYRVYGNEIALDKPEQPTVAKEEQVAPTKETFVDDYAPLTEEEANERDAMQGDRLYDVNDLYMPEEAEAPYYEEPTEAVSPFEEKDIQEVGNRKQKAYMYENPEVKPYFQAEANVMLGELRNSVKGEKHFNDQLYYDSNGEQGWYGTKRETSEQIAYMLDRFKYTYADIEKGLRAIIEDHGAENNAVSKRLEFMLDERLREGYTDFASGYEIPSNQEYINLLNEKQITEYSDEAYNRYLESLAYAETPADHFLDTTEMVEAPVDEVQVLYSLEAQQQEKIAELDSVVETEDSIEATTLPTVESVDTKLENYKTALEGYKTARATIETSFDDVINKKTAEYNALKRKDTQRATTLLMQIENMKLRKSNNIATLDSKISKVESTIDKMSNGIPTKRQIYHRNIVDKIKDTFSKKGFDFDKILENAKNKGTFSSVDNTPQRFIEKSLGYKEGQILNDLTINKVAQNETKGIQWLNSFTDKKDGLLAQISKEYGIKPRSKESASAQMYAEGFWVDDNGNFIKYGDKELALDYPNEKVRENIKKLAKDERIRKIYDETLKMINDSRKRNLYPEIPRRNNYFLHFREMEDTFSKLGIPFNPNDIRLKDLPTDINGVTADLKPGQPYFASAKQRLGYKTTYDLVGGVERYLNSAKNQIYHIDDIQTLRALRNYIADTYGQAKGLESLDSMTEEEAVARIEEVYNSHLSTFAKFLNEEANILAGKTSLTDRGLEGVIGRRGIQFLDTVNRQVGSNMVGANISSALTNTVSMVQSIAKSNKFDSTKAFAQTVSNQLGSIIGKTDGFVENNPMMIRRKGIEKMTRTPWESITDKGYLLMSAIDNISSEFIVRTKFNELTRKGMSEQQAHIEADKWASRILGDRSLGQQPQLYNSKMLGLVTKFQLEVRNQLDSQFYDTIQEAKVSNEEIENRLIRNMKTSAKVGSTFFQLAVLQHLFGQAFESVAGYNPAFDIVEALSQMLGLDDDEESEDTVLDNLEEGFLTLLGDLPYTSTFTGGRIPISSALPIKQFVTGLDSYGNEKSRWETIKETAPYYLAPTGYGQVKKTIAGLEMFNEEHPVAGSYTKSGNLRFPVEDTPLNRVQAGIFGQYASENARDYFDNERKPLNARQIEEYAKLDIPIRDYWDIREGLSKHSTNAEKTDYIGSLDLPVSKKNILINNILDRKEDVDMTGYEDFSSYEEFDFYTKNPEKYAISKAVGGYESYNAYIDAIKDIEGEKDENGKTKSGTAKANKREYIFSLDIDEGQKYILYRSQFDAQKDKDEYNPKIVDYLNGREDISYEDMITILESLDMQVLSDGTVIW